METAKTDNGLLASKLAVRRYFLRKYHGGGRFRVLDCCEGTGLLWSVLGREFACDVWGVDLKPGRGRLKVDSRRLLTAPIEAEVIDVDTYGSPWRHWFALLDGEPRALTVFLTWGLVTISGGKSGPEEREALGLVFPTLDVPHVLAATAAVIALVPPRMFARAREKGWGVLEAKEAPPSTNCRYFGVRLGPEA